MSFLRRVVAMFPERTQAEIKKWKYARELRQGIFVTDEPEFEVLDRYVHPGDWVVDIGANVGHYTKKLSDLVGAAGRVLAFEPIPTTFSLLASNVQRFPVQNVSLFNVAISDRTMAIGMALPRSSDGMANYYQAHVTSTADGEISVMTCALDSLKIENRVSLIKIDAEGHEAFVLSGMKSLIRESMPTLIIETGKKEIVDELRTVGYDSIVLPGSPNVLFTPRS